MVSQAAKPVRTKVALAISGSDPSGGAGLEADLKTFHGHGVYGMAVPTLLTVQNTLGVFKVKTMDPAFLEEQVDALLTDIFPDVIKIGALGSRQMLQAVVRILSQPRLAKVPVVVDTVIQSTSGAGLFDMRGLGDFLERVLPKATVITPNVPEFDLLSGKSTTPANAAAHLLAFGREMPFAILLKGGHFPGDPVDFLLHQGVIKSFTAPRLETPHTHGTGCVLASSLAANLAWGRSLPEAVEHARAFVRQSITENPGLGRGRGPLGISALRI